MPKGFRWLVVILAGFLSANSGRLRAEPAPSMTEGFEKLYRLSHHERMRLVAERTHAPLETLLQAPSNRNARSELVSISCANPDSDAGESKSRPQPSLSLTWTASLISIAAAGYGLRQRQRDDPN